MEFDGRSSTTHPATPRRSTGSATSGCVSTRSRRPCGSSRTANVYTEDGFFVEGHRDLQENHQARSDPARRLRATRRPVPRQGLVNEARTQYQVLADYYQKHDNAASAIAVLQRMVKLKTENPTPGATSRSSQGQRLLDKAISEYRLIAEMMLRKGHAEEAAQVLQGTGSQPRRPGLRHRRGSRTSTPVTGRPLPGCWRPPSSAIPRPPRSPSSPASIGGPPRPRPRLRPRHWPPRRRRWPRAACSSWTSISMSWKSPATPVPEAPVEIDWTFDAEARGARGHAGTAAAARPRAPGAHRRGGAAAAPGRRGSGRGGRGARPIRPQGQGGGALARGLGDRPSQRRRPRAARRALSRPGPPRPRRCWRGGCTAGHLGPGGRQRGLAVDPPAIVAGGRASRRAGSRGAAASTTPSTAPPYGRARIAGRALAVDRLRGLGSPGARAPSRPGGAARTAPARPRGGRREPLLARPGRGAAGAAPGRRKSCSTTRRDSSTSPPSSSTSFRKRSWRRSAMPSRRRRSSRSRRSSKGSRAASREHLDPRTTTPTTTSASPTTRWGSLDEAIGEFQLASKEPRYLVDCCSHARPLLPREGPAGARDQVVPQRPREPEPGPEEEHASACSTTSAPPTRKSATPTAPEAFMEVYGMNSNYRDIVARIKELGRR